MFYWILWKHKTLSFLIFEAENIQYWRFLNDLLIEEKNTCTLSESPKLFILILKSYLFVGQESITPNIYLITRFFLLQRRNFGWMFLFFQFFSASSVIIDVLNMNLAQLSHVTKICLGNTSKTPCKSPYNHFSHE